MGKILLTGSTGYIGRRLIPILLSKGFKLVCPVRDKRRFDFEDFSEVDLENLEVIEMDLSNKSSYDLLPKDITYAYFLVHSLKFKNDDFENIEEKIASTFKDYLDNSQIQHCVYLSGIVNDDKLSKHLKSRQNVEIILASSKVPVTTLRAGIVIGSGSASFEIIRDLVEKLPVMVAPKWINSKCQPIGIKNALEYLTGVLGNEKTYNQHFDIGGNEVLSYKEMLLNFARIRGLKRWIITVPVLSPKLSSKWLYFVTSTSYQLAANLVDSLKNDAICQENKIDNILDVEKLSYKQMLESTLQKVNFGEIISSWKDSFQDSEFNELFISNLKAPEHGVFTDRQEIFFERSTKDVISNIWQLGGENGWYYMNFLWKIRGLLDQIVGGVGLRRGRRSPNELKSGDALDFWRVLSANKVNGHLLLFAEMKLPGEAWLEFKINTKNDKTSLVQIATFRPKGILGRLYWYSVLPFHFFIFKGMASQIIKRK